MLEVLERSTESNDLNKNPVERQKETEENKQFVSNISEQVEKEKIITQPRTPLRRRVRVLHYILFFILNKNGERTTKRIHTS